MNASHDHNERDRTFMWIELFVVSAMFTLLMALFLPAVQQAIR